MIISPAVSHRSSSIPWTSRHCASAWRWPRQNTREKRCIYIEYHKYYCDYVNIYLIFCTCDALETAGEGGEVSAGDAGSHLGGAGGAPDAPAQPQEGIRRLRTPTATATATTGNDIVGCWRSGAVIGISVEYGCLLSGWLYIAKKLNENELRIRCCLKRLM